MVCVVQQAQRRRLQPLGPWIWWHIQNHEHLNPFDDLMDFQALLEESVAESVFFHVTATKG
jgi:hypothetical protein